MGAFADDTTPEEVDYQLESTSGDFRSDTVKMMAGETVLEVVSYRSLSDTSVTLEISEGAWITYCAYKEKTPQGVTYVDLGLPSGTLWASCNVGASKAEDYGGYYAWGETETKEDYSWATYKWGNYEANGYFTKYKNEDDELEPQDDAAYAHWGAGWRMPTMAQLKELKDYTTKETVKENDVTVIKLTSKVEGYTDKSIILRAVGYRIGDETKRRYDDCYFMSREISPEFPNALSAYFLDIPRPGFVGIVNRGRQMGHTVRPVRRLPKQK